MRIVAATAAIATPKKIASHTSTSRHCPWSFGAGCIMKHRELGGPAPVAFFGAGFRFHVPHVSLPAFASMDMATSLPPHQNFWRRDVPLPTLCAFQSTKSAKKSVLTIIIE